MNRVQSNTDGRKPQQVGGPIGMLVRGIAAGIGLASESIQHHKAKKASQPRSGRDDDNEAATDARLNQQMDEAVWELDEAQDEVSDRQSRPAATTDEEVAGLADSFLGAHPAPPPYSAGRLTLPVVITQRRPESRNKGFVRAYSPLLEDVGIDQTTFLDFLGKLNKSLAPSPWIQAINLAAFAGQAVPEPFTIMISLAVMKVTDAASELHSRSKTNRFLDRVNDDFFAPRGLVALIMTWKPSEKDSLLTMAEFDMQSSIAKASESSKRSRFESSSGATSFEWPQTAPLVFPALDDLAGEKKAAVKRSGKFVGAYMDKRARAKFAGENPDSGLANAAGKEKFASRYADPNHPASSGDVVALLTGGYISAGLGRGQPQNNDSRYGAQQGVHGNGVNGVNGVNGQNQQQLGYTHPQQDYTHQQAYTHPQQSHDSAVGHASSTTNPWQRGGQAIRGGGLGGIIGGGRGGIAGTGLGPLTLVEGAKKLFQDDVLYLMIVQKPSEQDMAVARERMPGLGRRRR
ncbi:hypothetical protein CC86DRAFT_375363 [Ophiobolus disseminans]|uniref:Uncharacterized protein n=1 Tax=Ophiobolus disseminans TaxID=1469910 RepID=A0A6A6ZEU7_9PLEO|nr:hypothetical protein CC86DRAFT_375363 [Ophiobolus disseminans]